MKRTLPLFLIVICTLYLSFLGRISIQFEPAEQHADAGDTVSRKTNILAGDEVLHEIDEKNITNTSGVVSIDVDELESTVQIGTTPVYLQDNSGRLEFSNDNSTWHDLAAMSGTESTTYTIGSEASTGIVTLSFGTQGAFRINLDSTALEFWDGQAWRNIDTRGRYVTYYEDATHTTTFLEQTLAGQFSNYSSPDLQLSAFANFADLATAENILHQIEVSYSCTMIRFGKNASNQLLFEMGTTYDVTCASTTYTTTATLSSVQQGRWVEYGVQIDDTSDTITFYVDGEVFESQSLTTSLTGQAVGGEILRIYEGWSGGGGPIKIGDLATWPVSGWKGIDTEFHTFPGVFLAIPMIEKASPVSDVVGGASFALHSSVGWDSLEGGF